jgi:HAE1 family hydrophobic/amphiphilic exporter-1
MDALAAVREAGVSRLRPILMTTVASVFGLLPMTGWLGWVPVIGKLGSGAGAELRAPMAVTVIAGLTSATLLTLIVIPSIYALIARHARPRSAT